MSNCDAKTGVCETSAAPSSHSESKCACGGVCGGDLVVCKMHVWECCFHEAIRSVKVEMLKVKIQKSWGPKLEKEADAVLEVMQAKWASIQAVGHAKEELREKFEQICKESK